MIDSVPQTDLTLGNDGRVLSSKGAQQRRGVRLLSFAGSLALFALFSAPSYAPDRAVALKADDYVASQSLYRANTFDMARRESSSFFESLTVVHQSLLDDPAMAADFTPRGYGTQEVDLPFARAHRLGARRFRGPAEGDDFDAFETRFALWSITTEETSGLRDSDSVPKGTEDEIACLAQNIYFEARGEDQIGKLAVGQVVMNRVASKKFPNRICEVVRQGGEQKRHRCQFSWWCDGKSDEPRDVTAWQESLALAKDIYRGQESDPTQGALWYHADYVSPYWRSAFDQGPTIGRHIFYRAKTKGNHTQVATSSSGN